MTEINIYPYEEAEKNCITIEKSLFQRLQNCAAVNHTTLSRELELAIRMYVDYAEEQFSEGQHR